MSRSTQDIVYGVVVGLGFAVFAAWGIPAWIETPSSVRIAAVSPAFWPEVVAVFLALSGFALAAGGLRRRLAEGARRREAGAASAGWNLNPPFTLAVFLAYYLLIDVIGIVCASALALAVMAVRYGERNRLVLSAVALGLPLALYGFFVWVAKVPMPLGLFG
ncbi:MAG: tripartite tricarboxylate transporter TctB family protein [Desulfovibrio aminophilus]|uniref:tripartite tricarboxylate transporter TctB family protein n=1 Tax=Desulfovibrio aminophilus TaxID=81425 RepID=UPI002A437793|nr:tripartite tricarboxylate transporter TctB family protein [Desulfovibrionaceae bacterium]